MVRFTIALCGLMLWPALLRAQITNLQVIDATPQEIILSYGIPPGHDPSVPCTVEASRNSDFSALEHDVDSSLFTSAGNDLARASTLVEGEQRRVTIGRRLAVEAALDGTNRERTLRMDTQYYLRVTCGASQATATTRTRNRQPGNTFTEPLLAGTAPWTYLNVSTNSLLVPSYVDPYFGGEVHHVNGAYGWTFAGTTGASGVTFSSAENLTAGWSPSSATLSAAVQADDANYAEYGGTNGEWLYLRLGDVGGTKYPGSSTYDQNELSYQNIRIKMACSGAGCSEGGEPVEVCITRDGSTCLANRTLNVGTSETMYVVCRDAPCTAEAATGDVITPERVSRDDYSPGDGRVYNTSANYHVVNFEQLSDCNRLRVNDQIQTVFGPSLQVFRAAITSINCSAAPPTATLNNDVLADFNGSGGVPFRYTSGIRNNQRYGVMIRKKNPTADATLRVNQVLWRAASSVYYNFAATSGGFMKTCQKPVSANGFNYCFVGNNTVIAVKPSGEGQPAVIKFVGMSRFSGPGGTTYCGGNVDDFLWDENTAGVFYCIVDMNYISPVTGRTGIGILKITYTGGDKECGEPGALCAAADRDSGNEFARWPAMPASVSVLTPCLNACATPADDYSLHGQMKRFDAGFPQANFLAASCGTSLGNHLICYFREGSQDSYSWISAFDLGNGLAPGSGYAGSYGNTQQIFGGFPPYARKGSRWAGQHSAAGPNGNDSFFNFESAGPKCAHYTFSTNILGSCSKVGSGTCGSCPSTIVDGVDYSGKNWCGTLNLTSSWNSAWGAAPPGFAPGEPVKDDTDGFQCKLHWLQTLEAGDYIYQPNGPEYLKVLQKNSANSIIVERGVGLDQSYLNPKTWPANTRWSTFPASINLNTQVGNPDVLYAASWRFKEDPTASNYGTGYMLTRYANHGFNARNVRVFPDYIVALQDFSDRNAMADNYTYSLLQVPNSFAGRPQTNSGATPEKHPSYNQANAEPEYQRAFLDSHPSLFLPNGQTAATKVPGKSYLYKHNPGSGYTLDAKHYSIAGYSGFYPFREQSGPASVLGDTAADAGTFCVAQAANECVTGSSPGELYFNHPNLDPTFSGCREASFFTDGLDSCFANTPAMTAIDVAQWEIPAANGLTVANGYAFRPLSRTSAYRTSPTQNVKPTPDGRFVFLPSPRYVLTPTWPTRDSTSRTTFVPIQIQTGSVPTGTTDAVVEFGYEENGLPSQLRCSPRAETCVATAPTMNESVPFRWASTDAPYAGVSCSESCTIELPGLSGRVLFFRIRYRDAGGATVAIGPLSNIAVP